MDERCSVSHVKKKFTIFRSEIQSRFEFTDNKICSFGCTVLRVLTHAYSHVSATSVQTEQFCHSPTPQNFLLQLFCYQPHTPSPGGHACVLLLIILPFSECHVMEIMQYEVSGFSFFHLIKQISDLSPFLPAGIVCSFIMLPSIPLDECATVCLSIHDG